MPADDYTAVPSTGKLKLKGVADSRVDKKKKRKKPKPESDTADAENAPPASDELVKDDFKDTSVMLRTLADEDAQITKDSRREVGLVDGTAISPATAPAESTSAENATDLRDHLRTDAQRRFEEQRRKRLEERLKRDGVKTHKQRVEELNKYLSGLSEHHDMPKIGPG